jgi:hypothetical protein
MPNLSFSGHLAGIVAGTLQFHGVLNGLLPSESYLIQMDNHWSTLQWLTSHPSFVPTTSSSYTTAGTTTNMRCCSVFHRALASMQQFARERCCRTTVVSSVEDDDWNGLPTVVVQQESKPGLTSLIV